jgi:hypothetical protein
MKSLILAFALFSALPAHADVPECTEATETLTGVLRQYVELMRFCQEHPDQKAIYRQNASDLETLYGRAESLCEQACAFDAFSQSLCSRIPSVSGACQ